MAPKDKKNPAPAAVEEPEAKKAKLDEEAKTEEAKPEEPKKFEEPDAPDDKRKACPETVGFDAADTTLNVIPTVGGKVLASIMDGGMYCLMAGARANVGVKAGRYMFEAKIVQVTADSRDKATGLRLRVGFTTTESTLVMPDQAASAVYFDSDGIFCADKKRKPIGNRSYFGKEQVVAVVLNLDSKSPNVNTVALYRDGIAIGEPQPLPEELKGKTLFPALSFRGCTVQVNFGPNPLKALPFKCRMVQGAAGADVEVVAAKTAKDGKCEVVLPVAFPDEGTFDWLDAFLEKNPKYVELSDRKIVEWAKLSGLYTKPHHGKNNSNDRPAIDFGVPAMNDFSVRKVIAAIAPVMPRNYLVMEVKSNLLAAERKEVLKKFSYSNYKKVAKVVMGEPNAEFKNQVQSKILKEKQAKADIAWRKEKAEKAKKKEMERKKKEAQKRQAEAQKKRAEIAAAKKKEEEEKKKKAEEEKKKAEEEKKKAEEAEKKEGETTESTEEKKEEATEEKKEDEKMEEEKKEEPKAEEKEDEKMEEKEEEPEEPEEPEETEPPKVELTDEEKAINFTKKSIPDVAPQVITSTFGKFTTPDKEEGFDDIQYEWLKGGEADSYLKEWVLKKKLTTRVEDLKPGEHFIEKKTEFAKLLKEWQDKLKAHKASGKKKEKKEGDEEDEGVDIFSVEDVMDAGDGIPLFEGFIDEDWQLVSLRFEMGMLAASFTKDCNDEDRTGIPLDHLGFYYSRYYSKPLECKRYGLADNTELINMIKDTVSLKDGLLVATRDDVESLDIFLKLSEGHRRERQRRIDAGDETARLKFLPPVEPKPVVPKPEAKGDKGESKGDKGDKGESKGKDFGSKGKDFGGKGKDGKDSKDSGKDKGYDKGYGKDYGYGKQGGKDEGKSGGKWGGKEDAPKIVSGYGNKGKDDSKGGKDFGKDKGGKDFGKDKGGKDFGKGGKDFGKGGKDFGKGGKDFGKDQKGDKGKSKGGWW